MNDLYQALVLQSNVVGTQETLSQRVAALEEGAAQEFVGPLSGQGGFRYGARNLLTQPATGDLMTRELQGAIPGGQALVFAREIMRVEGVAPLGATASSLRWEVIQNGSYYRALELGPASARVRNPQRTAAVPASPDPRDIPDVEWITARLATLEARIEELEGRTIATGELDDTFVLDTSELG